MEGFKINKKKYILLVFSLVLMVIILTGCFGSDVEDTVWETYNNEKFVLSYPGQDWHIINEEQMDTNTFNLSIGNAETESNSTQMLSFYGNETKIINNSEWNTYKSDLDSLFDGEKSVTTVDGYEAYKIHASGEMDIDGITRKVTMDYIFIWIEDEENIYNYTYGGLDGNYNKELSQNILDELKIK